VLQAIVLTVFAANVLNIGADLGAMAEASALLLPLPGWTYVVFFGVVCTAGQVFLSHTRYVSVLKWLTLSLFAYFGTVAVVKIPWDQLLTGLFIPALHFDRDFWLTVVAILGTTISPYLFFWQAAQEVEDTRTEPRREPLLREPAQGASALRRIRIDTLTGMGFSNLVALAIMVTAGATLHVSGITEINSAAQVARALRPLAGDAAFALFALGIIGTGLLSVPVLAGSAAYARPGRRYSSMVSASETLKGSSPSSGSMNIFSIVPSTTSIEYRQDRVPSKDSRWSTDMPIASVNSANGSATK
jgi:Mn2+/Fe2+ NRAMP family transporter